MYFDMIKNNLTKNDFEIQVLLETDSIVEASRYESKLIRQYKNKEKLYNSLQGASGRRVFSYDDIIFIRNLYQERRLYISEAYDLYYKNLVTFRAFKKAWHGDTFKNIAYHVYTEDNKKWHFSKGQSRPGSKNGRSVFNEQEVIKIRELRDCGYSYEYVKSLYSDKNAIAPKAFLGIWKNVSWKHLI